MRILSILCLLFYITVSVSVMCKEEEEIQDIFTPMTQILYLITLLIPLMYIIFN